jgi:hypothetical protein
MSRKRLSDLLREEVQRPTTDSLPEAIPASTNRSNPQPSSSKSQKKLASPIDGEATSAALPTSEFSLPVDQENTEAVTDTATDLLHNRVIDLEAELQEKNNRVIDLEAELQEKKHIVHNWQTELERTQELQNILEAQEKLIRQLQEKLQQEPIQQEKEDLQLVTQPIKYAYIMPNRPIARFLDNPSAAKNLSNEEIGWFD